MLFKKYKRVIALTCAIMMTVCSAIPVSAVTKGQLQKEKNKAESGLSSANAEVSNLEGEKQEAQEEVDEIDHQLVELLATMDILEDEIGAKKIAVADADQAHEQAKSEEKRQYDAMKARIRFMYEQGNTMYVEILMQAQSIADAVNKADYVEKVYDYDRKLLDDYQVAKQEAKECYEQLVNEEAELEGLQVEYKAQQAELEATLSEKKAVVENFDEKLSAARAEAKRYEAKVRETNKEIARIAAQEKAAREKAEREAREKAEREAKAKEEAAKASAGSSSSTYDESSQEGTYEKEKSTSSSAYDESSQEGTYKEEPKTEPTPAPAPSGGGSATGQAIASYACQFIGNPYVAGGTSLTNGTDCSGFTMSVYSHFGYSIPRNSAAQLGYGRGVSYSEAQPGDIVCYAGHVGIYIGNGMICHASTPATGIKTTVATYRPILSVRRIIG